MVAAPGRDVGGVLARASASLTPFSGAPYVWVRTNSTEVAVDRATVAGVEVDTRHWIGGRRVASRLTFADVSPIDGETIAEVARGGAEEVDAAVSAASEAFRTWSRT